MIQLWYAYVILYDSIMLQESQLLLASPYLTFRLSNWKTKKEYELLMESDYERNNWKEIIKGLSLKGCNI